MPGLPPKEILDENGKFIKKHEDESIKEEQIIISIDDLKERVCYFSLAGDLALKAFYDNKCSTYKDSGRERLKEAVTQRLYFAVLMFDKVVMHCSDPLRSEVVLEVLEQNIEWITNGRIVFIFSKHIEDIRRDYRRYIDDKINEYRYGYCTDKEAASLKQEHINDKYYERVFTVLSETKWFIRKSDGGNYSFQDLVIKDLDQRNESVVIDSKADLSQILSLNLSLFQLLHIRHLGDRQDEKNEKDHFVFPQDLVNDVIEHIKDCLEQGNIIARSVIVDSLEEEFEKSGKQLTKHQKNVLKAITLRMDILYCKMNSGKQLILEFHPLYENRSNYQIDCFIEYLKLLSGNKKKNVLTFDKINRILGTDVLTNFRHIYLSCMADCREYVKLDLSNDNTITLYNKTLLKAFRVVAEHNNIVNDNSLKEIRNILKEES